MKNLYISGITGRIGALLANKVIEDDYFKLSGGITSKDNARVGNDIGSFLGKENLGIFIDDDYPHDTGIDIIVDFSSPESTLDLLSQYHTEKMPVVIGTTGFDDSQLKTIKEFSQEQPILFAPNTSSGVAMMKKILSFTSNIFPEKSKINISETHHSEKKDSPSGTAKDLKEAISASFPKVEIDIQSYRKGNNTGEHTVSFDFGDEVIEITHKALDRSLFATGALSGAKWLISKPPGFYTMLDIYSS